MATYNEVKALLDEYSRKHGILVEIETSFKESSKDKHDKGASVYLYTKDDKRKCISLDVFSQEIYRKIAFKDSKTIFESLSTPDSFIIYNHNWYLIEFKNTCITKDKVKQNINSKAYQSWFMMQSVLYDMEEKGKNIIPDFYENPISFVKKNINFVLVYGESDNAQRVINYRNAKKAKVSYELPYIIKLEKYIYKTAVSIPSSEFESFLKGIEC